MKKSIIFLINGLGIERPGSYSISIDQSMPNLSRVKETSYFTTAITSSLEYRSAYQRFFLGDTYNTEIEYIKNNIINENIKDNPLTPTFVNNINIDNTKLHIFVEPTTKKVVDEINDFMKLFQFSQNKKIYMHLLLSQQTVSEYDKLISIIDYIKYHLDDRITAGFVIGKESLSEVLTKEQNDYMKKLFFYCSAERWTETDKKLNILKEQNIRPCEAPGFCTNNDCFISNNDTIFFFNTKRENYDNFIHAIFDNMETVFKEQQNIKICSLIKLYTEFNIPAFTENINYSNSLANIIQKYNKKVLIVADRNNINLINFYANGLNNVNNTNIAFAEHTDDLYNKEYIDNLINNSQYDLFIFDYYMDTSSTINHLKEELGKLDIIIGNLAAVSENKHSLFISSLFGLKKELPVADYNQEKVLINYEMQIPIFFYDYTYLRSKYDLFPGETNNILTSALRCIIESDEIETLIRPKTLLGSVLKSFIK